MRLDLEHQPLAIDLNQFGVAIATLFLFLSFRRGRVTSARISAPAAAIARRSARSISPAILNAA